MIEDAGIAHRLHERKQVYLPARVESQAARCLGVMQDISKCGGRVFVTRSFPVGTDIRVTLGGDVTRNCVVRRCVPLAEAQKFDIGFEVIDESWPTSVLPADDLGLSG
ncbi:MAG TPA: PilZ domain-containing protein [Bryobacteraceae bacterium]|jgi:hypothetical protein|nr:PilZ domain-containing protein [Bryobacteraceae bacterium]